MGTDSNTGFLLRNMPAYSDIDVKKIFDDLARDEKTVGFFGFTHGVGNRFMIDTRLSKKENYEKYKGSIRPVFLYESDQTPLEKIWNLIYYVPGFYVVMLIPAALVSWGIEDLTFKEIMAFLGLLFFFVLIIVIGIELAKQPNYRRKLSIFRRRLDNVYNDYWLTLNEYILDTKEWILEETERYTRLKFAHDNYKRGVAETQVSKQLENEDHQLADETNLKFKRNIELSKNYIHEFAHGLLFLRRQRIQFRADNDLLEIGKNRKDAERCYQTLTTLRTRIENLRSEDFNPHSLADQEILFELEQLDTLNLELEKLKVRDWS